MAFDRTKKYLDIIVEKNRWYSTLSRHHKISNSSKEEIDPLTPQAQKDPCLWYYIYRN